MRRPRLSRLGAPLLLLAVACTSTSRRGPPPSSVTLETEGVRGTVLQPWERHRSWSEAEWSDAFRYLQQLGLEHVLVQWTRWHDQRYFRPASHGSDSLRSVLGHILRQAERHGMHVWVGLAADSLWWSPKMGTDLEMSRVALARIRRQNRVTARRIASSLADPTVFAGWYLPEEIDDYRWRTDRARDLLRRHLRRSVAMLDSVLGTYPVTVSGYATGRRSPREAEEFWRRVLTRTGIDRLLFQDGVGAGHLGLEQLRPYLEAVADGTGEADVDLQVIVEPFERRQAERFTSDSAASHAFMFQPASWNRMRCQLLTVQEVGVFGSYLFEALQYMTPVGSPGAVELYHRFRAAMRDTPTAVRTRLPGNARAHRTPSVRRRLQ